MICHWCTHSRVGCDNAFDRSFFTLYIYVLHDACVSILTTIIKCSRMTQIRTRWSFAAIKHYFTCKRQQPWTEECEEPNIEIERDTAISRGTPPVCGLYPYHVRIVRDRALCRSTIVARTTRVNTEFFVWKIDPAFSLNAVNTIIVVGTVFYCVSTTS